MQSHQVNVSFVQQALLGDKQAFGQLVREHQSMVYSVCRSIVRNHLKYVKQPACRIEPSSADSIAPAGKLWKK